MPVSVTTLSKADRHDLRRDSAGFEGDFHRGELFEGVAVIFDQVAGLIVLARGAGEEAELRGLPDDQAEFAAGDADFGAFLHAEGRRRPAP